MRKKALLGLIITFALCMVAAGLIPLGKSYVSADSAGEDKTYYAPKTILSAGWWNSLTVNETENGTHIEFNGSNYVTIRTTSSVTYVADGLHLSIENFSGDGFGIAFSNMQGPDAYDAALRFFAFNNNDHTGVMRSSCPTWSNMEVLGTLATRPMNANFDIRLEKKADSSWNFIFDGQIFTVSAEKFASAITDPDHVYVSFTAYGGSNTIDSYSFDFVAIHDSSSKCAEDLTDDEKLLLKNVTEKIDAIGKVEVTPECYGKITAARGDYDALFDILKKMVKNYSTLKYAEQNYYVLTNALSFDEENVLMDMIVTTDNHLDTNDCTNYEDGSPQDRFNNTLSYASDKGVDAVLLLGDITDWARFDDSDGLVKARKQINMMKDSVEGYLSDDVSLFFTMGNHDSSDSEGEFRADLFYEVLGDAFYANDVNRSDPMWIRGFRHAKIGGLDFISISYDYTGELQNIQLDGVEWVKNKLKEITSAPDYTNEPIFLLSHVAFSNTVYGSGSRAEKPNKLKLYDVLAEYPQLVMLSGHSHFPVDNQTFIYQSDFTHVTAGATGYLDMIGTDFMTEGGYIVGSALIPYKHTTAQGLYLEVDKNYNIRVTRIDFNRGGRQIVDRVIIPAADLVNKTNLNYYTEARAERYPAPEFSANASLAADATSENSMEVTFDTIICDSVVQYYVIDIEDESGTRTFKSYAMNWIYPAFE
ncbi:MAG: metallophosphoesterase, partial [Clostridia bacterium]|nr:metallophosphoesterase [Clostridia bacterium]